MKRICVSDYFMSFLLTFILFLLLLLVTSSPAYSLEKTLNEKKNEKLCFMKMCCSELLKKSKALKTPKRTVFCKLIKNERKNLNFETCNLFQENFKNFFKFIFLADQSSFTVRKKCSDTLSINVETLNFNSENLNFKICLQGVKDIYLRTGFKNFTNKLCFKFVSGLGKDSINIVKRMRRDDNNFFVPVNNNNNRSYSQSVRDSIISRLRKTENKNLPSNKTFLTLKNLMETLNENLLKVHRDLENIFPNYASSNLSKTTGLGKEIYDRSQIFNFSIHKSPTQLNSNENLKHSSQITKSLEPVVIEILKEQNSEAMYINKETQDIVKTRTTTTTDSTNDATMSNNRKSKPITTHSVSIIDPHHEDTSHIIPEEANGKSEVADEGDVAGFSKHNNRVYNDEEIFGFKSLIGKKSFVPFPQENEENYFDSPLMPHEIASLNDQVIHNNRFRVKRRPNEYFGEKKNSFDNSLQSNKYNNEGNFLTSFSSKNFSKININSTGDSDEVDAIRRLNKENWLKLRTVLNSYFHSLVPETRQNENDFTAGSVDLSQWKHVKSFRKKKEEGKNQFHDPKPKNFLSGNIDIFHDDEFYNKFRIDDERDINLPLEFGYPKKICTKKQNKISSRLKQCLKNKSTFDIQGCESTIVVCSDTDVKFNDSTSKDILQKGSFCSLLLKYVSLKKEIKLLSFEANMTKINLELPCEQNFIQLTFRSQRERISVCGNSVLFSKSVKQFTTEEIQDEILIVFSPKLLFEIHYLKNNITGNIQSVGNNSKNKSFLNNEIKDAWKRSQRDSSGLEDREKIIIMFLLFFFFVICMSLFIRKCLSRNNPHLKEAKDRP